MKRNRWFSYLLSVTALLLLWQVVAWSLHSRLLPGPFAVITMLGSEMLSALFWEHTGASFLRITAGLAIAFVTAVPLGLVLGSSQRFDNLLEPVVSLVYPIPKIVLLPLILLVFGLGNMSKIVLIALIIFFQLLLPVRDSARQINREMIVSFRSLGGNRRQFVRHVVLPSSMPGIFTALRLGTGTAIAVLFFAESLSARAGLGYYILNAWGRADYTAMFVGMIALSLVGVFYYEVFAVLERRICPWRHLN